MIEIAVDIGGTFTDVVCLKDETYLETTKVSTTPHDLVEGIINGVLKVLQIAESSAEQIDRFIHGTTIATNAVLERKGAKTGILMTEGFEDVLEIGRQSRTSLYDLFLDPETPSFLSPRRQRVGITERINSKGEILIPLDEEQVRQAVSDMVSQYGVKAIAVCYLWSFKNPVHERKTKEIVHDLFPDMGVSLSCDIDPVFREYERLCVTTFDAYIRPTVEQYIRNLDEKLQQIGKGVRLQLMQSRGGITSAELAREKPVTMFLSGPAGGVIGGKHAGAQSGISNLITMDMGGTSCDISLITEGKPLITQQGKIERYPVRVPMVGVNTIGAGGGSVAWIDSAGGLRVGPMSAGADPGPACYGRGGEEPTVTDASLILGYLNPHYFAGGEVRLNADAAAKAMEKIATPLGIDITSAAYGIHRIINAKMAGEIRLVSVNQGYDPRRFTLLLLGGAGAVHGGALAAELNIPKIIVPEAPGVLSAFGLLVANVEHDHSQTFAVKVDEMDFGRAEAVYAELDALGIEKMKKDHVPIDQVRVTRSADMRYVGQSYELEVPVGGKINAQSLQEITAAFHALHKQMYGHSSPGSLVEFINLRTVHWYPLPKPRLERRSITSTLDDAVKMTRQAYFENCGEYIDTRVFQRCRIPIGTDIIGPAILEQEDTTIIIYPGQIGQLDPAGNIIITERNAHGC